MEKYFKLFSGVLAFFVYFFLLGLLINYFNHHTHRKAVHYVEKNDKRITVSLSEPPARQKKQAETPKPKNKSATIKKPEPKVTEKPKHKPKPIPVKKVKKPLKKENKKVVQKRSKRKKAKTKSVSKKKVDVSNLFDKVNERKPRIKNSRRSNKRSMKNEKDRDRGIQNAYFAKVEKVLQNWPSQSEFAGQTVKVWLRINRDGSFQFRLLSASNNEDFNSGLIQYLRQLQRVGFDPHRNSKPYELNVEFVAKE